MKIAKIILIIIIFVASLLRLFRLDQNPPSLYWDEASLGYNAFSILTTGHDEHGEFLPLARFVAYGDYKPPGYIYAIIPWMVIFGVNEFAIRFPSALAGILMVLATYYFSKKIFKNEAIGLLSAGFLAISPWSLQLSRAAFEAHLASLFHFIAIMAFLGALKRGWLFIVSMLFFIASFYTFNANRILAPLFILLLVIIYWKMILLQKKWVLISMIIGILLLLPSISYLQSRESKLRYQEVSIFTSLDIVKKANERIERSGNVWWAKIIHNRRVYFFKEFLHHYVDHFKGEYLFIKGDANPRLSTQEIGVLYLSELPFLIIGMLALIMRRSKISALLFGWIFLVPIPASVARETPHMLRTGSFLPVFQVVAAYGLFAAWQWISEKRKSFQYGFLFLLIFSTVGLLVYYLHMYWIHYPRDWAGEWQYGYKQMVAEVAKIENNYDRILVTQNYGRPYIYFLLYNKVNPLVYVDTRNAQRDWYGLWNVYGFGKYDFLEQPQQPNEKVLKVGTKGTFTTSGKKISEVNNLRNEVIFEIGEP